MGNIIIIAILLIITAFAIKGTLKHFKGRGSCCGGDGCDGSCCGGNVRPKKKGEQKWNNMQ